MSIQFNSNLFGIGKLKWHSLSLMYIPMFITVRQRSCRKVVFYTCLSVHRGRLCIVSLLSGFLLSVQGVSILEVLHPGGGGGQGGSLWRGSLRKGESLWRSTEAGGTHSTVMHSCFIYDYFCIGILDKMEDKGESPENIGKIVRLESNSRRNEDLQVQVQHHWPKQGREDNIERVIHHQSSFRLQILSRWAQGAYSLL